MSQGGGGEGVIREGCLSEKPTSKRKELIREGGVGVIKLLRYLSDRAWYRLCVFPLFPMEYALLPLFQIVTMYYRHGTLRFLDKLLQRYELSKYNNIHTRFQLSVEYLKVLDYLHHSPIGVRVMCDSPFLDKLLDQYLITDDFRLVVNDVDGLEEVTGEGGCHKRAANMSISSQLDIEQKGWPKESEPLQFQLRPVFDEKIDIWKIPWVLGKLLGRVKGSAFAKSQLREIMAKCHAIIPQHRPTANEVLQELLSVQQLIAKNFHPKSLDTVANSSTYIPTYPVLTKFTFN